MGKGRESPRGMIRNNKEIKTELGEKEREKPKYYREGETER